MKKNMIIIAKIVGSALILMVLVMSKNVVHAQTIIHSENGVDVYALPSNMTALDGSGNSPDISPYLISEGAEAQTSFCSGNTVGNSLMKQRTWIVDGTYSDVANNVGSLPYNSGLINPNNPYSPVSQGLIDAISPTPINGTNIKFHIRSALLFQNAGGSPWCVSAINQVVEKMYLLEYTFDGVDWVEDGIPVISSEIDLIYPALNQSVSTPVVINGIYDNNGFYDQFGIDLYYLNEQQQLVNEFTWHSIPVTTANDISFSWAIDTVPDQAYQIILSLNEQGGTNYFETDFMDFDTYGLIAPDPYEEVLDCDSLDIACHLKNAFSWAFIPTQDTLNSFAGLTVLDKKPFNYPQEVKDVWLIMQSGNSTAINLNIPFAGNTINIIDNTKIANSPHYNLMRGLMVAGLWFMFGMWVYHRGLRLF